MLLVEGFPSSGLIGGSALGLAGMRAGGGWWVLWLWSFASRVEGLRVEKGIVESV